ncbi:hypothetical protein PDE_01474 [Penicillium oxalicum 114-2]|uniref:Uncharacterized protein n=1 Tax=Penicillium oxalicum (strain 114-2 / CGMCC 5302) TaxID=933388 RepID=S8AX89_PENO1|nr:hypothetical protein PDE_01474 [Penicillium oxalicum 114-2]
MGVGIQGDHISINITSFDTHRNPSDRAPSKSTKGSLEGFIRTIPKLGTPITSILQNVLVVRAKLGCLEVSPTSYISAITGALLRSYTNDFIARDYKKITKLEELERRKKEELERIERERLESK